MNAEKEIRLVLVGNESSLPQSQVIIALASQDAAHSTSLEMPDQALGNRQGDLLLMDAVDPGCPGVATTVSCIDHDDRRICRQLVPGRLVRGSL